MKTITLTILAEDILLDNYLNCDECPITKALHRAGYSKLRDSGYIEGFDNDNNEVYISNILDGINVKYNDSYNELLLRLFSMYNSIFNQYTLRGKRVEAISIETFTHTITY